MRRFNKPRPRWKWHRPLWPKLYWLPLTTRQLFQSMWFLVNIVQQNQVVMTLATLNTLQLETTDLSERDITKVKIGSRKYFY